MLRLDELKTPLTNAIGSPSTTTRTFPLLDSKKTRGLEFNGATLQFVESGIEKNIEKKFVLKVLR
jgi:hypothetical protein